MVIKKKKEIVEYNFVKAEEDKVFYKKDQTRRRVSEVVLTECCEVS
jgi:hypothetical protein